MTVVLIGHGTYDGEDYRFNVPGADITGAELGQLFDRLPAKQQLIVNATSCERRDDRAWQRPERVVITATKSGGERTATRFAQFWVQAVSSDGADVNKDEIVTAAEAFDYANRQVAASFKSDVALATEHARIEGEDTRDFRGRAPRSSALSGSDPEVAALLAQRGQIEQRSRRRQRTQGGAEPGRVLRRARRRAGEARAAAEADRREAGGAVMSTRSRSIFFSCSPRSRQVRAVAQSIDYDPRRAPELRACDEHQHHGRVEQARACYSQLRQLDRTRSCRPKRLWATRRPAARERVLPRCRAGQRAGRAAARPLGAGCSCRRISTTMPRSCSAMR